PPARLRGTGSRRGVAAGTRPAPPRPLAPAARASACDPAGGVCRSLFGRAGGARLRPTCPPPLLPRPRRPSLGPSLRARGVRSAGAVVFLSRSTACPLFACFGAGTLVPPRTPPALAGPVPPAQALAFGVAAVLDGSAVEFAPRLRELSQRLGSDDAALLAVFCGEDAAHFAV